MAITHSAKKAIRSSARKHVFNLRRKNTLTDTTKSLVKALAAKNVKEAEKLLPAAYKAIDKACKTASLRKIPHRARNLVSRSQLKKQKGSFGALGQSRTGINSFGGSYPIR